MRVELIESISEALGRHGPMLGSELCRHHPNVPYLPIWQACFSAPNIQISHFSRYYLRFDITRKDFVRLSPSILRDFLSFTLFSMPGQREKVIARQVGLSNHHREISIEKIRIAQMLMIDVMSAIPQSEHAKFCAMLAGDLAYFLGHDEPRTVKQTGDVVSGSDIDIVVLYDGLDEKYVAKIDADIMTAKGFYLRKPAQKHEIDYICKPIERMFEQFNYRDIHEKIASKIVFEALFIGGSLELFGRVQDELVASGAMEKVQQDYDYGLAERKSAMRKLLRRDPGAHDENTQSLFFFSQERIEFT